MPHKASVAAARAPICIRRNAARVTSEISPHEIRLSETTREASIYLYIYIYYYYLRIADDAPTAACNEGDEIEPNSIRAAAYVVACSAVRL